MKSYINGKGKETIIATMPLGYLKNSLNYYAKLVKSEKEHGGTGEQSQKILDALREELEAREAI